jgi:N-acetylglucosaminyldiphosphoundecaprenol N-acetyl-beta-D-mannosaminyltransferase
MKAENKKNARKREQILGSYVDSTHRIDLLTIITSKLETRHKFYIVTPNPEIITMALYDKTLRESINNADLSIPDGVGLKFASKLLGYGDIEVIPGRELFISILKTRLQNKPLKIFLFGSTSNVIKLCLERIKKEFPNVTAEGSSGPRLKTNGEIATVRDVKLQKVSLDKINKFKPDILFVAFGAPKQEKWLARWLPTLNVGGAMTIGGTLDYFARTKQLPPHWMASSGLEWLWRLTHEKGHGRRVARAVLEFTFLVLQQKLGKLNKARYVA